MSRLALWQFKRDSALGRIIRAETWGAVNHDAVEFRDLRLYVEVGRTIRLIPPPTPVLQPGEWAARYTWTLDDESVRRGLIEAERLAGARYGMGELLRFPWPTRSLLRLLRIVHVSDRRLVCSAVSESIFRAAGYPLVHHDVPVPRVTPQMHLGSTDKYQATVEYFGVTGLLAEEAA